MSPWTPEDLAPAVTITLSEDPDEPTFLKTISVPTLKNVEEVQIRLVKTFDGAEEPFLTDTVSWLYFIVMVIFFFLVYNGVCHLDV